VETLIRRRIRPGKLPETSRRIPGTAFLEGRAARAIPGEKTPKEPLGKWDRDKSRTRSGGGELKRRGGEDRCSSPGGGEGRRHRGKTQRTCDRRYRPEADCQEQRKKKHLCRKIRGLRNPLTKGESACLQPGNENAPKGWQLGDCYTAPHRKEKRVGRKKLVTNVKRGGQRSGLVYQQCHRIF